VASFILKLKISDEDGHPADVVAATYNRATSVFGLTDSAELARPTKVCALQPVQYDEAKMFCSETRMFRSVATGKRRQGQGRIVYPNRGVGMRYWWVNQNQTFRQEIAAGYLWSPKRNANGARNPFYESMREVSPGDPIYSFVDTWIPRLDWRSRIAGRVRSQRSLVR
jgi:hypothetical protein